MFAHPSVVFEQVRKGFNPAATRPYPTPPPPSHGAPTQKPGAGSGRSRQTGRVTPPTDPAAALEALKQEDAPSAASFKAAEHWRDRLIAEGDAALAELVQQKPDADRTTLRQLARQATQEAAKKKSPRAARELFGPSLR